jgi:ribonuclease P protein component
MISSAFRFHGHSGLHFVYNRGQTVRGPSLTLKFARNPKRHDYRCAVVVSKKVSKSAVVRNRIRRRIYECVRLHQDQLQAYDLVFTVFSDSFATMPAADVQKLVLRQLAAAKLIAPPDGAAAPESRDTIKGEEK